MNQRGFVMVSFTSLSAVVLAAAMVLILLWSTLSKFQAGQKICLEESIRAQKQIAPLFERLFAFNKRAKPLIGEKRKLFIELAAATASGNPVWIAKVVAKIKVIVTQQLQIRLGQQAIFADATRIQWAWDWKISSQLRQRNIEGYETLPVPFAVARDDFDEIAPTYKYSSPFEFNQTSAYRFSIPWMLSKSRYAQDFWKGPKTLMEGECRVTLKEKTWNTKLIAAK